MNKITLAILNKAGAHERIRKRFRGRSDLCREAIPEAITLLSGGKRGKDFALLLCLLPDPGSRARVQFISEAAQHQREAEIGRALVNLDDAIAAARATFAASNADSEGYRLERQSEGKGLSMAQYRVHVASVAANYRREKVDDEKERDDKIAAARKTVAEAIEAAWKRYWIATSTAFAEAFDAISPAELSVSSSGYMDSPHAALASVLRKGDKSPHLPEAVGWIRRELQAIPEGETRSTRQLMARLGVPARRDAKRLSDQLCALRKTGSIDDCYSHHKTQSWVGKPLIEWHRPRDIGAGQQ